MTATGAKPSAAALPRHLFRLLPRLGPHPHGFALPHVLSGQNVQRLFAAGESPERAPAKLAVTNFKNGIFTRGILMDIPRLKGVPYLEPPQAIYPEDLDAWAKKAGIKWNRAT